MPYSLPATHLPNPKPSTSRSPTRAAERAMDIVAARDRAGNNLLHVACSDWFVDPNVTRVIMEAIQHCSSKWRVVDAINNEGEIGMTPLLLAIAMGQQEHARRDAAQIADLLLYPRKKKGRWEGGYGAGRRVVDVAGEGRRGEGEGAAAAGAAEGGVDQNRGRGGRRG